MTALPPGAGTGRRERLLHDAFEASLLLKALAAFSELGAGLALLLVPSGEIARLAGRLTAQEIAEDPADRLANLALHAAQGFSVGTQHFFALYLASHGLVKLAVLAALARGHLWAYPLSLAVIGWFILYQLYRLSLGLSWLPVGLTLFDLVVIGLILHEYRRVLAARS